MFSSWAHLKSKIMKTMRHIHKILFLSSSSPSLARSKPLTIFFGWFNRLIFLSLTNRLLLLLLLLLESHPEERRFFSSVLCRDALKLYFKMKFIKSTDSVSNRHERRYTNLNIFIHFFSWWHLKHILFTMKNVHAINWKFWHGNWK